MPHRARVLVLTPMYGIFPNHQVDVAHLTRFMDSTFLKAVGFQPEVESCEYARAAE